jgi:sugar O-acyltransferase (sialic acid O-acetyltransferase NeuD family)
MEKKEKVVIFGVGEIANVAHFYLSHDSPYEVVAFTVDKEFIKEKELFELPVVPFEEIEMIYPPDKFKMFAPISYKDVNKLRAEKYYQAKAKGYQLISYICSKATTWPGLVVGDNCFIFENNVIQPFVKIENNVILWSGNHVGHHTIIKDHCFITSQVVISGHVVVEPYCFLGVNSTIRDNITIAKECVIGAGALITKDTQEKGVYYGPAANILKTSGSSGKLKKI